MCAYVLTDTGKAMVTNILSGNPITFYLSGGNNPSSLTPASTDIALFSENAVRTIGAASAITTTTANDTLRVVGTYTATGNITLSEAGVSDSFTTPTIGVLQPSSTVIGSTSGTQVVTSTPLNIGNNSYIQIRTEVMKVTAGSSTNTLTVLRGQEGTMPISTIASNDPVAPGNPPGVSTVTGGNLFAKANFSPIALTTADVLVYTWEFVWQ